nr:immunoglobulin light chain junction region [Macaca mulatta]
CQQYNAYPYGF